MDRLDCTSNTGNEIISLKIMASQISDSGTPRTTSTFLTWRLSVVNSDLEVMAAEKQALRENKFLERLVSRNHGQIRGEGEGSTV